MGVDWHSSAIIGVKLDKPMVLTKTRACRHTEQASPFCSECGKPMWQSEREIHPKVYAIYEGGDSSGLQCCTSSDEAEYYIGMYMARTRSNRSGDYDAKIELPPVLNVMEIKAKLMEVLGDLYKERDFGLWTVLEAS